MENTNDAWPLIYIVDDDQDDQFFMKTAFESFVSSTAIRLFNNGKELIQHLENGLQGLPSFIIMDLNMPVMCGLDALKWIRNQQWLRKIPVIIFSTSANESDIRDCMDSGADQYISKPNQFSSYGQIAGKLKKQWIDKYLRTGTL